MKRTNTDIDSEISKWLLEENNPSVRYRTLTELLEKPPDNPEVVKTRNSILSSEPVTKIFSRMHPDGYWLWKNPRTGEVVGDGVLYGAFTTTHFCLAYLAELGLNQEHPLIYKAVNRYLNLQQEDGDFYRHFSCLYAYNIRTFIRLGFRNDSRVQKTIDLMLDTVRPDGGYLCDMHEGKYKTRAVKSCIRGSVKALMAFSELPEYWQHQRCKELINYFLRRDCLFRMDNLSQPINNDVVTTIFPVTWRAGLLDIFYALSTMGYGSKEQLLRAWGILEKKRDTRGRYVLDWTPSQVQKLINPGKRGEPNKWITLYALLSFKAMNKSA